MRSFCWRQWVRPLLARFGIRGEPRNETSEVYTTPADRPFVEALNQNPDDPVTRLVYADWLEEQQRPLRAALLRASVEGDAVGRDVSLPGEAKTASKGADAKKNLLSGLPRLPGVRWIGFDRGSARAEAEGIDALGALAAHDDIDCAVRLILRAEEMTRARFIQAAQAGNLYRVDELFLIGGEVSSSQLREMLNEYLSGLRVLRLQVAGLDDRAVDKLAVANAVSGLRRLEIHSGKITSEAIGALAWSPTMRQLSELIIRRQSPRFGIRGLLGSPLLERLQVLDLESNGLGRDMAGMIRLAHDITGARVINVSRNGLDHHVAHALTTARPVRDLEYLDLSRNPIGNRGLESLASSPRIAQVRSLNLRFSEVGDAGLIALAQSPYPVCLEWLDLGGCWIHERGFLELIGSPLARRLQWINLTDTPVRYAPPAFPWWLFSRRLYW